MYQAYQLDKLPRVALNLHQSVFVSQLPQGNRTPLPCIIRCYRPQKNQQQCLRKLQKSTHNLVVRPVDYRIIQGSVYFATQIQQMSLQTMIFLHKAQKTPMQKQLLKSFIKIFDTLNKVHKSGLYHGNLKPSNIFIKFPKQYLQSNTNKKNQQEQKNVQQPNFEQIQWKLGQTNINQASQNKYYSKCMIAPGNTSKSLYMDPFENDFYSLGVILLEMLSLQPIQKIHEDIINDQIDGGYLKKLRKINALIDDSRGAGQSIEKLMDLVRGLLNPKNIPAMGGMASNRSTMGLNSLYHQFQQSINYDRPASCPVPYYQYVLSPERLSQNFIKQNSIDLTLQSLKQNISKQQLTCSQILKYINKHIDPEDEFFFSLPNDFYQFVQDLLKYNFDSKLTGLLFAQYYLYESHVHYMGILMKIVSVVQLANSIMRKAIEKFESPSELFKQQADGKDVWKANDLIRFFNSLRVPFTNNEIQVVLRSWTNSEKDNVEINSLKIDQFRKVFKQYTSPKKTQRKIDERRTQEKGQKIQQLFSSLKKTHPNLVHFFRIMPGQYKWQLPLQKIRDEIKKYYKFRSQLQQKQVFEQVLSISRVSEGKTSIDYIKLLIKLNIYDPIQLFRYVLVQRINEDGMQVIYKKYQKDNKGWTKQSIVNFCERQYLSFDQKHQNFFFSMLDKDGSQYVDLKELMFKLTGLKQFDMEHFVNTLKDSTKNNGSKLFDAFLKIDRQAMFALNGVQQLKEVIEYIDEKINLQPDHYKQIYDKFSTRKGKFQYLVFLRYFVSLEQIFMRCCSLLIDTMFRGNFQQFFKTGLKGQQKKWKRQSITMVNDMALLKFKQKELDQVWHYLDPNQQNSLTKQQIAEKFNMKIEKLEEFKGRAVDSLNDFWPKRQQDKRNQISPKNQRNFNRQTPQSNKKSSLQNENKLEKNQLVVEMKSMRLLLILAKCFKNSYNQCSVWIQTEKFCDILRQQGMSYSKKFIETNFPYCLEKESSSTSRFNYLKFFFLVSQFRKDPQKSKAQCLLYLLTKVCQQKKLTAKKIFEEFRIRDDIMKLSKFESVIKQLLDDDIFFQDINDVWTFIGHPKFLTSKSLEKILSQEDVEMLRGNMKSSQQRSDQKSSGFNSRQRETPELRSRQQSAYDRRRKQSHQTFGPESYNMKGRNSFGREDEEKDKNQVQIQRRKQWRDSQMERKKSEKQKLSYKRERQRQKSSYEKQRQREKNSYQRQRQRQQTSTFQRDNDRRTNQNSRQSSGRQERKFQQSRQKQESSKKKGFVDKRTSMQNNLLDMRKRQPEAKLSRKDLLRKFQQKLQQHSTQELTRLFMANNKIQKQEMADCLQKYYDFGHRESVQLTEHLSDFGIVKIETVKKYLRPVGKSKDRYQRQEPSRGKNSKSKSKGVDFATKDRRDDRMVDPVSNTLKNRLINPQKRKLNIPLIKQQIKMFIRSFSQRYAIEQIQKYFFQQSDVLYRDEFVKKCRGVNSTLAQQNLQRIFDFLKPNEKDEVSIVNFKLAFNAEQNLGVTEIQYLPKELLKQLQQIFKTHDKDNSGNIQPSQVQSLLSTLGYNQSQKQIQAMFKKIDKNFDNQISFSQFKQFIEQFILPQIGQWQNDVQELFYMLKMNDVFGTGRIGLNVVMAIIERFGVKITMQQGLAVAKCIGTDSGDIPIYDFLYAFYYPTHPQLTPFAKSALYKIKYRKKISLKQIQKTFANISSNFIIAYTSKIMKSEQLKKSTCFQPQLHESYLFFNDYFYKDLRKVSWNGKNDKVLVDQDPKGQTAVVEIRVPEAVGVPIPQSQTVKSTILKRSMNVTFFDMSSQSAKHSIISLQADWDGQIQDQWVFDSKNRSFYMKIANYDAKKYEKMLILFELIITMVDSSGNLLQVSCGTASIGVKQLMSVDSKLSKKLKLSSGIPTKPKQIDRQAVTKRSGWKTFLGSSSVESQLSIDIFSQRNIDAKPTLSMIYALPSVCLVKRKSLHYVWTFREYFAERSVDRDSTINADYGFNHTVQAFLMSLDIDDISSMIMNFWRDKIQSSLKTIHESRSVMYNLLTDLYMILCTRQFELKMSNRCGTVMANKNLYALRQRMVQQMLENIQNFVKNDLSKGGQYKRIKAYNYSFQHTKKDFFGQSLQVLIEKGLINLKST